MSQRSIGFIAATGADVSADVDGYAFFIPGVSDISCQAIFTGSPVGTIKLQVSNDPQSPSKLSGVGQWFPDFNNIANQANVTNWTDVANSSQAVSAAGTFTWDYPQCGFAWIRCVYVHSSGTGTVRMEMFAKSRS